MDDSKDEDKAYGEAFETQHVHDVYEQIAPHFSSTRYKPWHRVQHFLLSLPPSSLILDLGTGNGKYLPLLPYASTSTSPNRGSIILASDRSPSLITLASHLHCRSTPHEAVVADILYPPFPLRRFDAAISVAVIHHLSTHERRVQGVRAMLGCLREGGRGLIEVWALEQRESRRGWGEGDRQDVMVGWVMKEPGAGRRKDQRGRRKKSLGARKNPDGVGGESGADAEDEDERRHGQGEAESKVEREERDTGRDRTFHRYYHLYCKGELEDDIVEAGGDVAESGYEKDNWWAIATPKVE